MFSLVRRLFKRRPAQAAPISEVEMLRSAAKAAGEHVEEMEAQVNRMCDEADRLNAKVDELAKKLAESQVGETRAMQEAAAYATAFERVGEVASYRIKKSPEESWPDYKRRTLDILATGAESPVAKAMLDVLSFKERWLYRTWLAAKSPAEAEWTRARCAAFREAREELVRAITYKSVVDRREEGLRDELDFAAMDLDDQRLAKGLRRH